MKIIDLVRAAKTKDAAPFGEVPDNQVAKMVGAVLRHVGQQIDETPEGKVLVPNFGRFLMRQVERKDKKKDKSETFRKVTFRRSKGSAKKKLVAGKKRAKAEQDAAKA
jgi:hypothetical protein